MSDATIPIQDGLYEDCSELVDSRKTAEKLQTTQRGHIMTTE